MQIQSKILLILLLLGFNSFAYSQEEVSIVSNDLQLSGTLIDPNSEAETVVLIISGSGKTDRDGNTFELGYINNCLKMIAEDLSSRGIASLRYDKRGVGKSINDSLNTEFLRFNQYIDDATIWINYLKSKYRHVIVLGHSQGSLIGIIAAQQGNPHKFISLAGIGESGYNTLKRQLSNQPKYVSDAAIPILDSLNNHIKVDSVPQFLYSLFNPKLQGYLMSWLNYSPEIEIKKLDIPILIIQGTTDIQITVDDAKTLANSNKNSDLVIINNMNHVLKYFEGDISQNISTYSNPNLPLHQELADTIVNFIRK
jgi:pimeloyl-ACP methyl ester carboxylesterase